MGERSRKHQKRLRNPKQRRVKHLSLNACSYRTAPSFQHPGTDTCVNLSPIHSRPGIKIYNSGACANGTTPMLGRYSSSGCRDTPTSLTPITEDKIKTCLNTDGVSSVSFWCTGEIVATTPRLPRTEGTFGTSSVWRRKKGRGEHTWMGILGGGAVGRLVCFWIVGDGVAGFWDWGEG
jgi:hypothetical protein